MSNTTQKRSFSKIIILAIVLLVPGFLYLLLNRIGSNEYVKLPVYGEKSLSGKVNRKMGREIPDTTYHQLTPIDFINSEGDTIHFLGSDSVITVVHLFYTKDTALSRSMMDNLFTIANRFKNNSSVRLLSISVDPSDIPDSLKSYARPYDTLIGKYWNTVSAPHVDLLKYAREEMLIDAMRNPVDTNTFVISNNYLLIDSQRRIRGFYDINLKTEVDRLEDEIKLQMVEEIRNNPLKVEQR
ncbi:SCO family protein [Sphingobacterium pedocola]|uniref:Photosynthetic protein synthase I n=1 Tax=Sphingobacterium pedocola TaxID=2082722 RepID=A0ABR9T3Z7_9SPHI|nr:SCO family protein [Sphingobacterium pedocola]MBE8720077.1 photosynthetic protein synthase I [Sphingobacterium pedocola]